MPWLVRIREARFSTEVDGLAFYTNHTVTGRFTFAALSMDV
jgi:hypothetical protein